MKPTLCSKCKKNLAVVFITKIENGETINEGYCLKCAKELGIKPVDDMISRMGLSDEDLAKKLDAKRASDAAKVLQKDAALQEELKK